MKPTTLVAVALIVAGLVATWAPISPGPEPIPTPADDATRAAVAPVRAKLANHKEDGARLASFYACLADVIARDQGKVIATTAHLRELHRRAGLLMFQQTGITGKHPGLAEAIDKVLADRVRLENVSLDAAKQKAAIDAFRAIAWACQGG